MRRSGTDSITEALGLDTAVVAERVHAIGLTPEDLAALRAAWSWVEPRALAFLPRLYAHLRRTPALSELLRQESRVQRLIAQQQAYLRQLFQCRFDAEYVRQRVTIGSVHHQLRITPQWYLATFALFLAEHVDIFLEAAPSIDEGLRLVDTLQRVVLLDAAFALDAYCRSEELALAPSGPPSEAGGGGPERATDQAGHTSRAPSGTGGVEAGAARIRLEDSEVAQRVSYIGWTEEQGALLRAAAPSVEAALPGILAAFYTFIRATPALSPLVDETRIDGLVRQVQSYWSELFRGRLDRAHAASRMRIGVIHEQVDLGLQWYLIGLGRQLSGVLAALPRVGADLAGTAKATLRAVYFDITFVVDAYMEARAHSLRETRGFASQLLEGLASAVAVVDARSWVMFANERFIDLCGVAPALLYMTPLADVIGDERLLQEVATMRERGLARSRCTAVLGSGEYRVTLTSLARAEDRARRAIALVFDDVRQIMRVTGEFQDDVAHLQRLADTVGAVLWEMDWDSQTITSISRATFDLLGEPATTWLGRANAWVERIAEPDRAEFVTTCASLARIERARCDYRMRRSDGRQIWVRTELRRSSSDQGALRIAAITREVSDELHAERLRAKALEDVAARFAAILNNALTAITGNIELHRETGGGLEADTYCERALQAARGAAEVARRLLAFAGLQAHHPVETDIAAVVREARAELELAAGPRAVVRLDLHEETWPCSIDPVALVRALGHLCENSRRAMPTGGTITVSTRNVLPEETDPRVDSADSSWVDVSVEDTGEGMPESVRIHAVEPFFTTQREGAHLGLGLSTVHGFTQSSGGRLWIESRPGRGTKVTLRLPRAESFLLPRVAVPADPTSPTVLVLEPDPAVANVIEARLARLGLRVVSAPSAKHALGGGASQAIDIVLVDAGEGRGSAGIELARQLTETMPELGVVLMTAGRSLVPTSLPEGWIVLAKPFSAQELEAAVRGRLSSRVDALAGRALLTPREREVLQSLAAGRTQVETGELLGISDRTVEQHVRSAKRKLQASNTIHAVVEALAKREIKS